MQLVSMILILLAQIAGTPEVKNTPVAESLMQCVTDIKLAQSGVVKDTSKSTVTDFEKELKTNKANLEKEIIEIRGVMLTKTYGKDSTSYRQYIKDTLDLSGNSDFYKLTSTDIDKKLKEEIVERFNEISAINVKLAQAGINYTNTNLDFFKEDIPEMTQPVAPLCLKGDSCYKSGV